jgi:hypothetical protein
VGAVISARVDTHHDAHTAYIDCHRMNVTLIVLTPVMMSLKLHVWTSVRMSLIFPILTPPRMPLILLAWTPLRMLIRVPK